MLPQVDYEIVRGRSDPKLCIEEGENLRPVIRGVVDQVEKDLRSGVLGPGFRMGADRQGHLGLGTPSTGPTLHGRDSIRAERSPGRGTSRRRAGQGHPFG